MNTELDNSWIQTYTGKAFFPLSPEIKDIDIIDIAWALSMQCRYAGHCKRFYSVAEHSVLISRAVPTGDRLIGLLHDASEAYLVDIPRPIKWAMGGYAGYEATLMNAIAIRFGLRDVTTEAVKDADARILHNERAALMPGGDRDWTIPGEPLPNIKVIGRSPRGAFELFMAEFRYLTGEGDRAALLSDRAQ